MLGAAASLTMRFSTTLITTNYPYTHTGGEVMFVAPEVQRLVREMGPIRVVPQHARGARLDVPDGVELDLSLARMLRRRWAWGWTTACSWPGFGAELRRGWRRGGWVGALRVWRWATLAQATYRWAQQQLPSGDAPALLYTYWRGGSTLALVRWAGQRQRTRVVTRAHRYELYEDAFTPPFQPWHPQLYHQLNATALVSQHGLHYLQLAGVPRERLVLARLGTEPAAQLARASPDGVVRLVSSSFAVAVKRLPLLAACVLQWAQQAPHQKIMWTHFGNGPELAQVRAVLRAAPPNLQAHLAGQVTQPEVLAHYASQPVDLFMLLSSSEGLPVSIQEAVAAGIPVLATKVGGVSEIVDELSGILLPSDPTIEEVVTALALLFAPDNANQRAAMRLAALARWQTGFSAEHNHTQFAHHLIRLMEDA
jgi:glycosyltransferase involved in cell wall biosynthesis